MNKVVSVVLGGLLESLHSFFQGAADTVLATNTTAVAAASGGDAAILREQVRRLIIEKKELQEQLMALQAKKK
jgi:hypothetical protein